MCSGRGLGRTLHYIAVKDYILLLCILGEKRSGFHTSKLLNDSFDNDINNQLDATAERSPLSFPRHPIVNIPFWQCFISDISYE